MTLEQFVGAMRARAIASPETGPIPNPRKPVIQSELEGRADSTRNRVIKYQRRMEPDILEPSALETST